MVIPFYNEADGVEHVAETLARLDALLAQRELVAEYLFVDDGSVDGTADLLRARLGTHPAFRLLAHPGNRGFGAAFRTGAEGAHAPLLACYDFDCTYPVEDVLALLDAVRREVAVLIPPPWHRFPHSFSHIFAGGYCAGYYSYKWAEVLSADAFAAFEEAGAGRGSLLDRDTGARFWREVLAVGGSRPALDSFIAFRGRAPQVDALLRHSGMLEAT